MADKKISQLTNLTGANLADNDEFVLVDTSADETKAITWSELKEGLDTGTGFVRITGDTMTGDLSFDGGDTIYGDNDKAIFGAGSDLQIYHDGSHSYISDQGTGNLRLLVANFQVNTSGNDGTYIRAGNSDDVELFYGGTGGSVKLATTSTGIDVTGQLVADSGQFDGNVNIDGTVTADGLTVDGATLLNTSTYFGINSNTPQIRMLDLDSNISYAMLDASSGSFVVDVDANNATAGSYFAVKSDATERMRIDSSGNLLVGKTSQATATIGAELGSSGYVSGSRDGNTAGFFNRATSDGEVIRITKDGSTVGSISTHSTRLAIGSDDTYIMFDSGDTPSIWPSSGSAGLDNTIDIGDPTYRFDDIYATNGTIQTSDRNEKQDIEVLSDAEQRVAVACKGLLRKFRWKDAVAEKGDDARIHFGIIAQDLQDAFTAEGLDAGRYAMFISSTWTDEETGEERTRMGVRYPELLAFIIAAI